MTIRIVLADDHRIILEGLEQLFSREKDFEVIGTATNGEDALESVRNKKPDILVLDINMPKGNGLWVLKNVHTEKLKTRVVLLTATLDDDEVLEAMQSGVSGLVLKEAAAVNLVDTVRRVQRGERALEPMLVSRALERLSQREEAKKIVEVLSKRETEIVKMVATGLRNKEIALKLSIGEGTVKTHLHTIYEKLGVHGRVELAMYALERGII
ncbi:MAG TPA: response regulator transcription factor [Thermoanaerobaculia bacterium]|nr:response regulator transcription factor [Thermoanaerobaculia bacterium]